MLTSSSDGIPVLESRNVVRRRFIMSLGVIAVIGLIALLLAGRGGNDRVEGSGSTALQPLIQRLSVDFQNARSGDQDWVSGSSGIDYEAVGSLGGVMRLADPEMDFAITDYPLSSSHLAQLGAVQFPVMIGGVSPVYNPGPAGAGKPALRFSAAVLAGIFSGGITNWSDPAIAAENPGVALPALPIKLVYRIDGSGTTFNFTSFLAQRDAGWKNRFGAGTTIEWTGGTGVKGSAEMASTIAATPGAIGYLETGQARRAALSIGLVRNDAGQFTAPTNANLRAAGAADAYPLTATFYAVMKRNNASPADNDRALRFFAFLLDQGSGAARSLGYVALPDSTITDVRAIWARDLGADHPRPGQTEN